MNLFYSWMEYSLISYIRINTILVVKGGYYNLESEDYVMWSTRLTKIKLQKETLDAMGLFSLSHPIMPTKMRPKDYNKDYDKTIKTLGIKVGPNDMMRDH